ncbi:MAG TPA: MG2 domain-containing protein [Bryobacteraceae bacterium]|jgi:hypothetical protein|nr:MG2 domain-containing protein [Bryobacteraceae bacterium]
MEHNVFGRHKLNRQSLKLFLLLAAAAAGLSQSETQPYFALFADRTFPSGGKPNVSLTAWNVDSLDFRVYRVADPQKFFEQLEDSHQFGGHVPRPARERTLLEKIHSWKHGLRTDIRRSLRAQFNESPSDQLMGRAAPARNISSPGANGVPYAGAPLLNSQQLALTFTQPVRSQSRWERSVVDVGVHDKGIYLVEAVHGDLRAYTILMVSDIAMVTKSAQGKLTNFLVDRTSGQPIPAVKIALLARDEHISDTETDGDGIANLQLPPAAKGAGQQRDFRILAARGSDFAINTLGDYWSGAAQWMGYIYTDRPVYRPGHTVYFKGVFRTGAPGAYEVPAGKNVSVTINGPDQKPVFQKTLTANSAGAVHDDLTLPADAALGNYFVEVKPAQGEGYMSGDFEVQEYKKPEYEVHVTPTRTRVLQGDDMHATIDARYYFGEPVSGAKVKYSVYRSRYWAPFWYEGDDDSEEPAGDAGDVADAGDQLNEVDGQLDADGKLSVTLPTTMSQHKEDYIYTIEAKVTDQANREISGKSWVVATYGSFAVNVTPDRYFYSPGSDAGFQVQSRNYDNQPVRATVHVELLQWDRHDPDHWISRGAADVDTGDAGSATAHLTLPPQGGSYQVRAMASTPEHRVVEDTSYLWVSGGGEFGFRGSSDKNIQIVPDKKSYRAGDTAKLLVVTGRPNTPLYLTVEGRDLRECKLLRSADSTATFELPVTASDEPGITVNAAFIRDGEFYNGTKYLKAPPLEHQLNLKIATDKPQYQPGQTANYAIDVTGSDGKPVGGADLSLGVVDEAIYGVRPDTTQSILEFFFGRQWNRVFTAESLEYQFSGEAGKRRMRLAELRPATRLAQLKPERLVQPKVRKAFPDTAFWAADLTTDNNGHAQAKVDFPDSLTTWRATARAITPATKVGSSVIKTVVRKNLIVRLAAPRFFVQGDEVILSVLVHNYLPDAKTARVSLDVTGLDVLDGATRDVPVPSRGEVKLDWRVRAQQVRSTTLLAKALTDQESDALQLDLPVNIPGIRMALPHGGSLEPGATANFDLTFPQKVQPGSRSLAIEVSPSIAGSLFGALDYLTSFPYGCVEQTMSSFLPDITVQQAVRDLGLKTDLDQAGLQVKIRDGLERLYNFQHDDGGWGWWQTDDSHPFMTAYVVAGLAQAQAAGSTVEQDRIQRGGAWLLQDFARDSKMAPDLRAYIAYAMLVSRQSDFAPFREVYEKRAALSPYGLAMLGLALEQAKDSRAGEIATELAGKVDQNQSEAWWKATRDAMLDFDEDASPEATAWAVKFLSHQHPDSPLLPKAALWLMNHRDEGYWWSSTKQTAMVIYGLSDYLKASHELTPNLTVTVLVNDRPALTRTLDNATALAAAPLTLDESKLQPGANHIRVTASGTGRLYYSTRAEYYSADDRLQKTGSVSLNLLRDYFRLTPTREGDHIVYDTTPLNGPAAVGDILAVRLTMTGSDWKYVMIEDPIPAGTEFIEHDEQYQLKSRPPWWEYDFTRRELHDDRLAIFKTYSPQGQEQYFYLLKVINAGIFQVSPARVGPMYQTDVMATSESRRLEVK